MRENVPMRDWPLLLFQKSVLKQKKYQELFRLLESVDGLHCLDVGSDNGVISFLFRQMGGTWKSADLDEQSIRSIRELVGSEVYEIDGTVTPFQDNEFDRVVIVDFLEHIPDDAAFVQELYRILKQGGILIANVPHVKNSLLRKFRLAIGQTDERHGHLRPGYTVDSLKALLCDRFTVTETRTYSKFFSESIDILINLAFALLRKNQAATPKGLLVTGQDLQRYRRSFQIYSMIYPVVWLISRLDALLFFRDGYMLVAKATVNKGSMGS